MITQNQKILILKIIKQEIIDLQIRLPKIISEVLSDPNELLESCLFGWEIVNKMYLNIEE